MEKVRAVYIPGLPDKDPPLARFLPALPAGAVRSWLESTVPGGALLLDPLGSTPALPLEIARTGRRVLVACNNPLLSFIIETLASAPQPAEFQSALAELFSTRRGAERLETHLQSLYSTACPNCGHVHQAAGYLWRKGETAPFARLIRCPACQTEGEFPLAPADLSTLAALSGGSDQLHRSRAIGRIFLGEEGEAEIAEEAVNAYGPRALYVLTTLINRADGLPATPQRKRLLFALLLSLLDLGSALWAWPTARSRPRQLTIPAQFREINLFTACDAAITEWCAPGAPIPVTHWPELPPESGGICVYTGRIRSLLPLPDGLTPAASTVVLPRPNSAFWTLSAVWSGWLWGRETAQPLKSVFERRRYDWHWHAAALFSTFRAVNASIGPGMRLFAHVPEPAPGFINAALAASQAAGLALDGVALRGENDPAQIHWRTARDKPRKTITTTESLLRQGMRTFLQETGEPAEHLLLYTAGLRHLAQEGGYPQSTPQVTPQTLDAVTAAASKAFSDRKFLDHLGGGASEESGRYWLAHPEGAAPPLPERLETYLRDLLAMSGALDYPAMEAAANRVFRGIQTVTPALLRAVIEAIAEPTALADNRWQLRPSETEAAQAAWVGGVETLLARLAEAQGLQPGGAQPLLWHTPAGNPLFAFYTSAGGALSPVLLGEPVLPRAQCVLVYPEQRATLVELRLQRDPRLLAALGDGWRLLRADSLRRYAADAGQPTLENFEALLSSAAPHWSDATQMQIF